MSSVIDPSSVFTYVLVEDREKPSDLQRSLQFRRLSARGSNEIERLFADSFNQSTSEAIVGKCIEALATAVVGWSGFDLPFNVADLDAVLDRADVFELRDNLTYEMTLSGVKKKQSASLLQSTVESSAE